MHCKALIHGSPLPLGLSSPRLPWAAPGESFSAQSCSSAACGQLLCQTKLLHHQQPPGQKSIPGKSYACSELRVVRCISWKRPRLLLGSRKW